MSDPIDFKPFDIRLRMAMGDIEKILEKHNVGGQVDLVSKTHVEYRFFAPKWAPHTKDIKTGGVVWHIRKDNPEGNNLIVHFISALFEQMTHSWMVLKRYHDWIEEKFEPVHHKGPEVRAPEILPTSDDEPDGEK